MKKLPYDVSRCDGTKPKSRATACVIDGKMIDLQCAECARRVSPPRGEYQVYIQPTEFINGECPERIES
jgi:hypothetical protein